MLQTQAKIPKTKLQVVEKPIAQSSRFAFKKSCHAAAPATQSPQASMLKTTTSNKILSATNHNHHQRRDSCGPIITATTSCISRSSPNHNQQADSQKFYTTGGLFIDSAQNMPQSTSTGVGVGPGAHNRKRNTTVLMNSTNETSFTEVVQQQTSHTQQTPTNRMPNFISVQRSNHADQQRSARPPPMLVSGYQSHPQETQNRFTLLKARGEQGSKQLKHDVAQQIIDSNAAPT